MTLKATNESEASRSILVSFDSQWVKLLETQQVSKVFRKRGPSKMQPTTMYVYAGAPIKAVVGRLQVTACVRSSLKDCLNHANEGKITPSDLTSYAASYDELYVFSVGKYEPFKSILSFDTLRAQFGFSPPQSFMILSSEGAAVLANKGGLLKDKKHEQQ